MEKHRVYAIFSLKMQRSKQCSSIGKRKARSSTIYDAQVMPARAIPMDAIF